LGQFGVGVNSDDVQIAKEIESLAVELDIAQCHNKSKFPPALAPKHLCFSRERIE
jgi:hypothetical protein